MRGLTIGGLRQYYFNHLARLNSLSYWAIEVCICICCRTSLIYINFTTYFYRIFWSCTDDAVCVSVAGISAVTINERIMNIVTQSFKKSCPKLFDRSAL